MIGKIAAKILLSILGISILAGIVLVGLDGYHYVKRKIFAVSDGRETAVVETEGASLPSLVSGNDPAVPLDSSTSTLQAERGENARVVTSPGVSDRTATSSLSAPPSFSLIANGVIDPTWKNNSWGTTLSSHSDEKVLLADLGATWSAISLYSAGFNLKDVRSIELSYYFVPESGTSSLYLAFYQGRDRLGAVPLTPYSDVEGTHRIQVPLADMELKANYITDVVIESENPARVAFSDITFSSAVVPSRKAVPAPLVSSEETPILVPAQSTPPETRPRIYFEGMQSGWLVDTRRARLNLMDTTNSITGTALRISFDTTTSAISFTHPNGFATKGYSYVYFSVYGGVTDHTWQQLYVSFYDVAGNRLGTVDMAAFSARGHILNQQWAEFQVPLRELHASNVVIGTIDIENASVTEPGDSVWLDNVGFGTY